MIIMLKYVLSETCLHCNEERMLSVILYTRIKWNIHFSSMLHVKILFTYVLIIAESEIILQK